MPKLPSIITGPTMLADACTSQNLYRRCQGDTIYTSTTMMLDQKELHPGHFIHAIIAQGTCMIPVNHPSRAIKQKYSQTGASILGGDGGTRPPPIFRLGGRISNCPPHFFICSMKLELYKRREAARSYNSDYTSGEGRNVWNTSGMTFPKG